MGVAFGMGTEMRGKMVTVDEGFAKGYAELCLRFKTSWYGGDPDEEDEEDGGEDGVQLMEAVDLLGGGTDSAPPRDLLVSVRVLKDIGEIETLSGSRMSLNKGSQYYLALDDVDNLIVQGALERVDD